MISYRSTPDLTEITDGDDQETLRDPELLQREAEAGTLNQQRLRYYQAVARGKWQDTPILMDAELYDQLVEQSKGIRHSEIPESERGNYALPSDPDEPVEHIYGYFTFVDDLDDLAQPKLSNICVEVTDATYLIIGQHSHNAPGRSLRNVALEHGLAIISYRDFMRQSNGACPASYRISSLGGHHPDPYQLARQLFDPRTVPTIPAQDSD